MIDLSVIPQQEITVYCAMAISAGLGFIAGLWS